MIKTGTAGKLSNYLKNKIGTKKRFIKCKLIFYNLNEMYIN